MTVERVAIDRLEMDEFPAAVALLDAADLPTEGVTPDGIRLYGATLDGQLLGVAGLETYGADGLLRSVAVEPSRRGDGLGSRLTRFVEDRARALGVTRLYLLTTTATGFFAASGYEVVDRDRVPRDIRRTSEFEDICPETARCLTKQLDS